MKSPRVFSVLLLLVFAFAIDAHAQWGINLDSAPYPYELGIPGAASDGSNGVVVAWADDESQFVYAKRITSTGGVTWGPVEVGYTEAAAVEAPQVVKQGSNWFVAWIDPHDAHGGPDYLIRIAKLNSSGSVIGSTSISDTTVSAAEDLRMVARTGGGIAIVWRSGTRSYVQYYDSNLSPGFGNSLGWVHGSNLARLVDDGADGVVIVWQDSGLSYAELRAMRLDGDGDPVWNDIEIVAIGHPGGTDAVSVCSDGDGGVVIAAEWLYSSTRRVYVQQVKDEGDGVASALWSEYGYEGRQICLSCPYGDLRMANVVLHSSQDYAIVSWERFVSPYSRLFAQKVPLNGSFSLAWGNTGVQVNEGNYDMGVHGAVANMDGLTAFVWEEYKFIFDNAGIYYQILDSDGASVLLDGEDVAITTGYTSFPIDLGTLVEQPLGAFAPSRWYGDDSIDARLSRPVPAFCDVETVFNEEHCKNNVSWKADFTGTANKLTYHRIGSGAPWSTKNATGSGGMYSAGFTQNMPTEFKLQTTLNSVVHESPIFEDQTECGVPDPEGAPIADARGTETFLSAHPNPFNPQVRIEYGLSETSAVELAIFDVSGRLVRNLVSASKPAGTHSATWNGDDDAGRKVSSGVYFGRLVTGGKTITHKLVMTK